MSEQLFFVFYCKISIYLGQDYFDIIRAADSVEKHSTVTPTLGSAIIKYHIIIGHFMKVADETIYISHLQYID